MVVENVPVFLLQNNKSQLYPHDEKYLLHPSLLHAWCGLTLADLRLLWRHILKIVGQLPPPRSKPKNARVFWKARLYVIPKNSNFAFSFVMARKLSHIYLCITHLSQSFCLFNKFVLNNFWRPIYD